MILSLDIKDKFIKDVVILTIYELINVLFFYKYVSRIVSSPGIYSFIYLIAVNLLVLLLLHLPKGISSWTNQQRFYIISVILFGVIITVVMLQVDPQSIRVGRYPALQQWITRLLHLQYPYAASSRPSGFPFLFVLTIPFFLLGDLGFFQIVSFFIFTVLILPKYHQQLMNRYRAFLLLICSPVFLYEIVTRSDLFSNMVLVILYLTIFELLYEKANGIAFPILYGGIGGLVLSTRGIVLLIYSAVLGYYFLKISFRKNLFLLSMLSGFLLTLMPFLLWDWRSFLYSGPFAIQMSYVPTWLLILALALSLLCAVKSKSLKSIYLSVSCLLFGVILIAFLIVVVDGGWQRAVFYNGFDISYFSFSLPFLLISTNFFQKEEPLRCGHLISAER